MNLSKVIEKLEDFLKTIIVKYWYVDMTVTIGAFLLLYIIQKIKQKRVENSE